MSASSLQNVLSVPLFTLFVTIPSIYEFVVCQVNTKIGFTRYFFLPFFKFIDRRMLEIHSIHWQLVFLDSSVAIIREVHMYKFELTLCIGSKQEFIAYNMTYYMTIFSYNMRIAPNMQVYEQNRFSPEKTYDNVTTTSTYTIRCNIVIQKNNSSKNCKLLIYRVFHDERSLEKYRETTLCLLLCHIKRNRMLFPFY